MSFPALLSLFPLLSHFGRCGAGAHTEVRGLAMPDEVAKMMAVWFGEKKGAWKSRDFSRKQENKASSHLPASLIQLQGSRRIL